MGLRSHNSQRSHPRDASEPILVSWFIIALLDSLEHYDRRSETERAFIISVLEILYGNLINALNGRGPVSVIEDIDEGVARKLNRPLRSSSGRLRA